MFLPIISPMSYLSNELMNIIAEKGIAQADLARLTRLDQSKISRWINGQSRIKPEDLVKLTTTISSDPIDRARLVIAHLRDECQAGSEKVPGSELVSIKLKEASTALKETNSYRVESLSLEDPELPPITGPLRKALHTIRRHLSDPDLSGIILYFADLYDRKAKREKKPDHETEKGKSK